MVLTMFARHGRQAVVAALQILPFAPRQATLLITIFKADQTVGLSLNIAGLAAAQPAVAQPPVDEPLQLVPALGDRLPVAIIAPVAVAAVVPVIAVAAVVPVIAVTTVVPVIMVSITAVVPITPMILFIAAAIVAVLMALGLGHGGDRDGSRGQGEGGDEKLLHHLTSP